MKRGRKPQFASKEAREFYTQYRDIAQKRIKRGKARGLNTPMMQKHYGGFKKLRDIKSAKEFRKEYKKLREFVRTTSQTTIMGNKKVYDKVYAKLTEPPHYDEYGNLIEGKMYGVKNFTRKDLDTFGMFMNLSDVAENETKILGSPDITVIYADMFLDRNHTAAQKKKLLKEYAQSVLKENKTKEGKAAVLDVVKRNYKRFGFKSEDGAVKNLSKGAKDAHDRYIEAFNKRFGESEKPRGRKRKK